MSPVKNLFVVGGTGSLGRKITLSILDSKKFDEVKILIRSRASENEDKKKVIEEFKSKGGIIVEGNLDDIEALKKSNFSLSRVHSTDLSGSDTVVSVLSGPELQKSQLTLLDAAKSVGVKRFVPSEYGIEFAGIPLNEFFIGVPKAAVRSALENSGLEWTYIITGFFLDRVYSPFIGFNLQEGKVIIPGDGNQKLSFTHTEDIAKFVPADPSAKNSTVNAIGTSFTLNEAVNVYEKVTGKTLQREHRSVEDFHKIVSESRDIFPKIIAQVGAVNAQGLAYSESHASRYPSINPITLQQFTASAFGSK